MRSIVVIMAIVVQLLSIGLPASAASFDPTAVKISVEDSLWEKYHAVNPNILGGDVEKIYKIKKIEVRLLAGDKEFGSHTFTPEDRKAQTFSLLYGLSSALTVRIKAFAADNVIWIISYPYKYTGDDIVIKSLPTSVTLNYPGI